MKRRCLRCAPEGALRIDHAIAPPLKDALDRALFKAGPSKSLAQQRQIGSSIGPKGTIPY